MFVWLGGVAVTQRQAPVFVHPIVAWWDYKTDGTHRPGVQPRCIYFGVARLIKVFDRVVVSPPLGSKSGLEIQEINPDIPPVRRLLYYYLFNINELCR